jgi:predicted homoserine dehydrogenase-like protein
MMAIIRRARARGDNRSHRKFGIVTDGIFTDGIATDGMRMSGLAVVALAYAIATSSLL